ncbi:MAG: hypothetical protein AAGJ31_10810, partial [Verrucomicrobiota bacterium]
MSCWIGTSLWSLAQEAEVIVPSMDDAKALVADVIAEEAGEEVQKLAEGILDLLEKISQEEGERDGYREKASTARGEVDSYREAVGELLEGAEDVIELDEGGETDPEVLERAIIDAKAIVGERRMVLGEAEEEIRTLEGFDPESFQRRLEALREEGFEAEREGATWLNSEGVEAEVRRSHWAAVGRLAMVQAERLREEMQSREPRLSSWRAKRELEAARLERGEQRLEQLESRLSELRWEQVREAEVKLKESAPEKGSEEETLLQHLSDEFAWATKRLEEVRTAKKSARSEFEEIIGKKDRIQGLMQKGGEGRAFAPILIEELRGLPRMEGVRGRISSQSKEIAQTRAKLFQLEQRKGNVFEGDLEEQRASLVEQVDAAYDDLIDNLIALSSEEFGYLGEVKEFRSYLEGKVFWVPSSSPLGLETFGQLSKGLDALAAPSLMGQLRDGVRALREVSWLVVLLLFLPLAILWLLRPRLIRRLRATGIAIRRISTDRWGWTGEALLLTVALAIPGPLLFGLLAWLFGQHSAGNDGLYGLSAAFAWTCPILFSFRFINEVGRPSGLGEEHFGWGRRRLTRLRRDLRWLSVGYLPLLFGCIWLVKWGIAEEVDPIARLLFIAALAWTGLMVHRLIHPKTGFPSGYLERHAGGWLDSFKGVWWSLA